MPTSATDTYAPSTDRLDPYYRQDKAMQQHVQLANGTYARGAVLGEVLGSPGTFDHVADTVITAPTAAPTLTTPTGGSLASGDYTVGYTYVDADGNESALSPLATTTAAGNDLVHVAAVTPLPSGVASVNWYMSRGAGEPDLGFKANGTGAAADFTTAPTATNPDPPSGATSGTSGDAKAILRNACTVSGGLITFSDDAGIAHKSAPVYIGGGAVYKTEELSGLTQKAITDLGAALVSGTLADGLLRF